MYTQEIACPQCGKLTIVNIIDKSDNTRTPCASCKYKIKVTVDKNGKVEKIEIDNSCFITTACVMSMNLPDDCTELTVLRKFRDEYVANTNNGSKLIGEYYSISPRIVENILKESRSKEIFNEIFLQIKSAVKLINERQEMKAFTLYCAIVKDLKDRFLSKEY